MFNSMYIKNPYSHTPSQIFPFSLETNILIKCILLMAQLINQNRSWPGVFTCPSHCPGHFGQVQDEQEDLFYFHTPQLVVGGKAVGAETLQWGGNWMCQMQISELRSSGKIFSATL